MVVVYIIEFLLFGFCGWIIDSLDRSIEERQWMSGGYFRVPFCPIYGFGGLILMFVLRYYSGLAWPFLVLAATAALVLVEYLGWIFSERVLQVKLWDYSRARFNVGGYIDLRHSFCWLILAILFYRYIFPYVVVMEDMVKVKVPDYLNLPALILVVLIFLSAIIRKSPTRFLEFKDKMLNLSVTDYQHLVADIKKMYSAKAKYDVDDLKNKISKRLAKAGAQLKKRGE